ncbi:MAG: hypothetical protein HYZ89_02235 [Candidatus Omnitrophica bacterium]|nr:hypothetical protein [Candidatus Omnitrophota bacterium]
MIVGVALSGMVSSLSAQEHAGKPLEEKKAQPAAPASATSTTAPKTARAQGSITSLTLTGQAPELKVRGSDGKTWTFALNPKTLVVWKNGQLSKPEELKNGDRVNVRYLEKDGKNWVRAIEIVQAPQPTNVPAAPAPVAPPAAPAPAPAASMAPMATPVAPPVPPVVAPMTSPVAPNEQKKVDSNSP